MELIHAKLARGEGVGGNTVYQYDFVFGSPLTDTQGMPIGSMKPVHMTIMNGMEPDSFAVGLRLLADHIEKEFNIKPTT
jgi:hypothetical protein